MDREGIDFLILVGAVVVFALALITLVVWLASVRIKIDRRIRRAEFWRQAREHWRELYREQSDD